MHQAEDLEQEINVNKYSKGNALFKEKKRKLQLFQRDLGVKYFKIIYEC